MTRAHDEAMGGDDPILPERPRRRAERAEAELAKARLVIEIQGKASALLEQLLTTPSRAAYGVKSPTDRGEEATKASIRPRVQRCTVRKATTKAYVC